MFSSLKKPVKELPPDLRTSRSFIPLWSVPTKRSLPADPSTVAETTRFSSPSRRNECGCGPSPSTCESGINEKQQHPVRSELASGAGGGSGESSSRLTRS